MNQFDWMKHEIQAALDQKGWSQAELCRKTGGALKPGALSSFMRGRTRTISQSKVGAIEEALGVNLSDWPAPATSALHAATTVHLDPYGKGASIVPVVVFARFPTGMEGQQLRDELEKIASRHRLSSVADPAAFSAPVEDDFESFKAGDELTFSPATPPVHQDFVAIRHPDNGVPALARFFVLDGDCFAVMADGSHVKNPYVLGVAVDLWRPLLSQSRRK